MQIQIKLEVLLYIVLLNGTSPTFINNKRIIYKGLFVKTILSLSLVKLILREG